jgi:hypothetical protein
MYGRRRSQNTLRPPESPTPYHADGAPSPGGVRTTLSRWSSWSWKKKKCAELFEAMGFLCVMVAYIVAASLKLNGGVLIYARDDTYIHMSIARHLVLHHVWGVTPYAFVSASSSPLWTSLLASSYWLFGVGDKAPLVLSLLSAIALLILIYKLLRRAALNETEIPVILFVVVFVMPMPYLVLDAMEPALHTILTIGFLYCASELLDTDRNRRRDAIVLAILAPLLVAARFEGLFLLTIAASLFVIRRRYLYAIPGRSYRHSFDDAWRLDPAEFRNAQRKLALGKRTRVGGASRNRRDGESRILKGAMPDRSTRDGGVVPQRGSEKSVERAEDAARDFSRNFFRASHVRAYWQAISVRSLSSCNRNCCSRFMLERAVVRAVNCAATKSIEAIGVRDHRDCLTNASRFIAAIWTRTLRSAPRRSRIT